MSRILSTLVLVVCSFALLQAEQPQILPQETRKAIAAYLAGNASSEDRELAIRMLDTASKLDPDHFDVQLGLKRLLAGRDYQPGTRYDALKTAEYLLQVADYLRAQPGAEHQAMAARLAELAAALGDDQVEAKARSLGLPPAAWPEVEAPRVAGATAEEEPIDPTLSGNASLVCLLVSRQTAKNYEGDHLSLSLHTLPAPSNRNQVTLPDQAGPDFVKSATLAGNLTTQRARLPRGVAFQFHFDSDGPVDGGSAGSLMRTLAHAAIRDIVLDDRVAVTGEILPNGGIGRVGAVMFKLNHLKGRDVKIAAVPKGNADEVYDLIVPDPFLGEQSDIPWKVQIFQYETADELLDIARKHRPAALQEAIDRFNALRSSPSRSRTYLVQELQQILALAPNHLSASALLKKELGQAPARLSENTSILHLDPLAEHFYLILLFSLESRKIPLDLIERTRKQLDALKKMANPAVEGWVVELNTMLEQTASLSRVSTFVEARDRLRAIAQRGKTLGALIESRMAQMSWMVKGEQARQPVEKK